MKLWSQNSWRRYRGRRYVVYRQHSEEDCGAACLAAIATHFRAAIAFHQIREAVGTGQQGTTLLGLQRGADELGFHARPVQADAVVLDYLSEMPLPAIIHWQGNHWVVFYGQRGHRYVIADPAVGLRFISRQELEAGWSDWVALLLTPDLQRLHSHSQTPRSSRRYLLQSAWFFRDTLVNIGLMSTLLGLLSLMTPFLIQVLTDDVLVRQDVGLLNTVAIAIMALILVSSSIGWVQSHLILHFAKRMELGLVLEFARKLLHLPLTYYESHRSGEIASRLQDIQLINQLLAQAIVSLPGQVFVALVSLCVMGIYNGPLALTALVISVGMALSPLSFFTTLQQKTRQTLVLDAENQGVLVETFKGALTLKTLTADPQFWDEFQSRFGRLSRLGFRTAQIGIINSTCSGLVSGMGNIALLWLGGRLVTQNQLTIGQLLAFYSMNRNVVALISSLIGFLDEFTRVRAATQRLGDVIDVSPEVRPGERKSSVLLADDTGIWCENITFFYPSQVDFIHQLSAYIPGGRVTAIVGPSGCGKSTLVKLIAGLYPIQGGNIRLGIYNLEDIALDSLRQQVMLVSQDAHFWSRSILDNFRLGCPHASLSEVVEVCRQVDADRFISQLPDKYRTVLGEFGANLSGGQQQRLAIARTLLHNPSILILDESTSGLDHDSEARLLDQMLQHRRGKTTILISHRAAVVERADWLVVMDEGQVLYQQHGDQQHGDRLRSHSETTKEPGIASSLFTQSLTSNR